MVSLLHFLIAGLLAGRNTIQIMHVCFLIAIYYLHRIALKFFQHINQHLWDIFKYIVLHAWSREHIIKHSRILLGFHVKSLSIHISAFLNCAKKFRYLKFTYLITFFSFHQQLIIYCYIHCNLLYPHPTSGVLRSSEP